MTRVAAHDADAVREIHQPQAYEYVFGRYADPIAYVDPGERIAIYTEDAFHSRIRRPEDRPSQVLTGPPNPQTGPIYVNGAEPGDTLIVDLIAIEPTRDWAASALAPYFGGLTSTALTRTLQDPLPEKVWIYQLRDGVFYCDGKFAIPWQPFTGTMGTAPALEAISSQTPAQHGGNMDVPEVCPGHRIYFPVAVPGAYFFTGDCHGAQGLGELGGSALEITARVIVSFSLLKGQAITWPRIESATEIMTVGSARPMEDAARIAYAELVVWLESEYHFDRWDAYQLLTQAGRLTVANMVDPNYSLVASIAKQHLTAPPVSGR